MKKDYSKSTLTPAQCKEIRKRIIEFCRKPRTYEEVKEEMQERFSISGISVALFMSNLTWERILQHTPRSRKYKRIGKRTENYKWSGLNSSGCAREQS